MLILVIFCQHIFVNISNNAPFYFVEPSLRGNYLKPERSNNISQKIFTQSLQIFFLSKNHVL